MNTQYSNNHNEPFRCDECGKFIALKDIEDGLAVHQLVTVDSYYSQESYETLCKNHYVQSVKDNSHE